MVLQGGGNSVIGCSRSFWEHAETRKKSQKKPTPASVRVMVHEMRDTDRARYRQFN